MRVRGDLSVFGLPPIGKSSKRKTILDTSPSIIEVCSATNNPPPLPIMSASSSTSLSTSRGNSSNILLNFRTSKLPSLPVLRGTPTDDSYMSFTASIWDFVAVYPDVHEDPLKMRFWIAQLGSDVPQNCKEDDMLYIFYFEADNADYTIFAKPGGRKRETIAYKSLLSRVEVLSFDEEKGIVMISKEEKARLSERGRKLDTMKPNDNSGKRRSKKSKKI